MISTGIDVGARNVKVVIINNGKIVTKTMVPTGFDPTISAQTALSKAIEQSGLAEGDIQQILATGVNADMASHATGKISMVRAIAKAGAYFFPNARTVIDVGAEDARAVKCDEKGNVAGFVANDRCAAGAGAFIEAMTRALELKLEEMGALSLTSDKAIPMNAQCVIFGESEVVTLIHQGTSKANIARAVYDAMSDRISSMVRRLGINPDVALIGGVAKDVGVVSSLKKNLRVDLFIPEEPEFAAAVGAALSSTQEKLEGRSISIPKVELGEDESGGEKKEYWRWPEAIKTIEGMDYKKAKVISAGIDVGSVGSKCAIMLDGDLYSYSVMRTGSNSPDSAIKVLNAALSGTSGLTEKDIHFIVGTGYGRVNVPMAKKAITEIACHGRGANYIWGPTVKTVLDVGGQDVKAIRTDEKGRIVSFLMNDKCAAGTGRGMEVFADLLSIPIQEVGAQSMKVKEDPPPVSSTCTVFAKSEAVSLLRKGWNKEMVLAAYCIAMAQRMYELLHKVGVEKEFVITGGQSKNIGVVKRIEKLVGFSCLPVPQKNGSTIDPQLAGAIGAALFAKALFEKSQNG